MTTKNISGLGLRLVLTLSMILFVHYIWGQPSVASPDGRIKITLNVEDGKLFYSLAYKGKIVLEHSQLGLERSDADFSSQLKFVSASSTQKVADHYTLLTAKKYNIVYSANKKIFHFNNDKGDLLDIIFQLSNDGVAFRYYFPGLSADKKIIVKENTSFHFQPGTTAWLQPLSKTRSGWEHSNPSYEEHYLQNVPVTTPSPLGSGWIYPSLFRSNDVWLMITESSLDNSFCGSHLDTGQGDELQIVYPDSLQRFTPGDFLPASSLPWFTPWRIICVGSLKTIAESTLGTDVAKPAVKMNGTFIKPGKASWSWINSKDNFIVYDEQKKYIDFAADMHWQYCLIDADWDTKIGYEKISELATYAKSKNIGLLLWYNSTGDWNTVKYHPKGQLTTHDGRVKEFSRLKAMGIKGIKADFFGGDGRSMIQYYIDILRDAADFQLLVNFHGATLPRSWQRTYPNLLTTEAIRGFEMVTFTQDDADKEATHCTILPFTRNVYDPMDFTPMNLYKVYTNVQRRTSSAFELALSVLFLSGIQHFAESPDGMSYVPVFVKSFLQDLPVHWDDVRFIDGFPGKEVIIARRSGKKWYIAGINGEATEKVWTLDLSFLNNRIARIITDGTNDLFSQSTQKIYSAEPFILKVKPNGGFVAIVD